MYLLKKLVQFGGKTHGAISSWKTGWNNQFALGYEIGLYYNFTLEGNTYLNKLIWKKEVY